uniref:AAA+ ATPase domain-containing protein n=1 Tax=viral metagenome TaxID=1070528 RepID=A0A6C0DR01_9ZZZZ
MEQIDFNNIFEREKIAKDIKNILLSFDKEYNNVTFKRGIYIYGSPGCGKTYFLLNLLKELNYDVIKYDAGDVRNKSLIDTITSNNVSNRNVLHMMSRQVKKIAIVMDEIDGMNNGDKGGITALIKLIRQKKTKKQRLENKTLNPIICIGNYYVDKKIRELMKVCNVFELKEPTTLQMKTVLYQIVPTVQTKPPPMIKNILSYIQGDMRKLFFMVGMLKNNSELINDSIINDILQIKTYNDDAKNITQHLINNHISFEDHNVCMNETDRTIVALLWHENIVDCLENKSPEKTYPFYLTILDNICYADYIDRITFQNQIWQFNEMSSLMKTFYNNKLFHDTFKNTTNKPNHSGEIRFTKVLTKYSTEYNNILFIYNLCQLLDLDKKDLISLFQEIRLHYGNDFLNKLETLNEVEQFFDNEEISKLDIKRMYRYLDKNVKKETIITGEDLENDLDD